ncbi:MAG: cryptochrome/photolyase family protein [Sphingorhabdus sp.]
MMPTILWFRRDLRLSDQAAVLAAAGRGNPVIPVFILDDDTPRHRRMAGASRWWLHHSLQSLDRDLQKIGSRLILRRGSVCDILPSLVEETGASAIHCLNHYEPWWRNAERTIRDRLPVRAALVRHDGLYLMPPGSVTTGSGSPYRIYSPFAKALSQHMPPPEPRAAPVKLPAPDRWPTSDRLEDWGLLPTRPDWAGGLRETWQPGERGAARNLDAFLDAAANYGTGRNLPSSVGTSSLSPHLHFGEVSPAAVWHATMHRGGSTDVYLKELIWRDYAANVIVQFPEYGSRNARPQFDHFPWRDSVNREVIRDLTAWEQGRTGYPIVDAGMRQLWATGWMHNRVRMIAASFLIKHLLIDWRVGEQWFWDTLVDADYASNAVNWQWVAGSGIDSNMFTRIMAPLTQSEKFDSAQYIRKWVPELAHLSDSQIHDPEEFGARPTAYPSKIIGHREARDRAMAAYREMKEKSSNQFLHSREGGNPSPEIEIYALGDGPPPAQG